MAKKTLVLLAHPTIEESRINKAMKDAIADVASITVQELYKNYPTFEIDVPFEQGLLEAHDRIVFQFPFYWYSTPALLKEWEDQVLAYNFAYGEEGTALKGKEFFVATSTGGPEEAYQKGGYNNFSIRDLLAPLEQTANLCGMNYQTPFVTHGVRTLSDEDLTQIAAQYRERLLAD